MLTFDTSNATKDKQVKIDGTVYTIHPLSAKAYMQLMNHQDTIKRMSDGSLQGAELVKAQSDMFDIVRPLISPSDEFSKWEQHVRERNEMAYFTVMARLLSLIVDSNVAIKE